MKVLRNSVSAAELGQPDASIWRKAAVERVALFGTPLALQPSPFIINTWRDKKIGKIGAVDFSALHNGDLLALRLSWADPSQDVDLRDNDSFPDGAAVMFPINQDAPLVTMGSPEQPVNAWHWRADRPQAARNNVAIGLGSTRVTKDVSIATQAFYRAGHWHVVFLRKLQVAGATSSAVQFAIGQPTRIAFAVWEGSNGERGGLKAYSPEWRTITPA